MKWRNPATFLKWFYSFAYISYQPTSGGSCAETGGNKQGPRERT